MRASTSRSRPGEFFTLLGPSGSGKTTTLRMIAGFEDPSGGTIELAGRDVGGVPPYDRAVNTVFQDYALFPHMTVGENVAYGLRVAGVAKAERARRRDEALEMVRLPGYGDAQAGRALRRAAPARRPGAGDRQPAPGAAARRAARRPRPEAARADADRAEDDPGRGRHHLRLRHPRPGRGADDERPDRRLQRGQDRAGQHAGRALRAARRPSSSPASSASPTCSSATARASRSAPRRSSCSTPRRAPNGLRTERGRIADVAYAGMVTRYTVALDAGGELQLIRQNVEGASVDAASEQGREVLVGWRPEHTVAVRRDQLTEEESP